MTTTPTGPLPDQLSSLDAGFLYAELPHKPLHIGFCLRYAGPLRRDALLALLDERLHRVPRLRQRAVFPPYAVARPAWEDDPAFDLGRHVVERPLPAPADDQVLSEVGGEVFAVPLDRAHPLWQVTLLPGRPDGSTAVLWTMHHAMVDGVAAVTVLRSLHDQAAPASPDPPARSGYVRPFSSPPPGVTPPALPGMVLPAPPPLAPPTPFNGPVSGARRFAWAACSLGAIRAIRAALGGTINDLVLAVLAGGLGRYLRAHGYPTAGVVLPIGCPVNMRRPEERAALGNIVTTVVVPLYVGLADPVARLAAQRAAMDEIKRRGQAAAQHAQETAWSGLIPPLWQALGARVDMPNLLLTAFATNVPGPTSPLSLGGHMLQSAHLLGPVGNGLGLFNATLSYHQQLTITATVDPALLPDVWFYAACLDEAFAELAHAAETRADGARTRAA